MQRRLRRERRLLDLCAMHGNKLLQCKKLPDRDRRMQECGFPERNNVNIVCDVACDVAYDMTVTTYDVKSRTYDIAYDESHTTS